VTVFTVSVTPPVTFWMVSPRPIAPALLPAIKATKATLTIGTSLALWVFVMNLRISTSFYNYNTRDGKGRYS
jgi:hypothetical protein